MNYISYVTPIKNYNYAIKYEDYYGLGDYINPIRNDSSDYQPGKFEGLTLAEK